MLNKVKNWSLLVLFMASLGFTQGAYGLSCVQPNFAESFNRLNEAPETYWVAFGTLTPNGKAQPMPHPYGVDRLPLGDPNRAVPMFYPVVFHGGFMDGNSLVYSGQHDMAFEAKCAGPWCAGAPVIGKQSMFFVKIDETSARSLQTGLPFMKHELGPCPGGVQSQPSYEQVEAIQACLRFGSCGPRQISSFVIRR